MPWMSLDIVSMALMQRRSLPYRHQEPGERIPIGQGKVNFPAVLERLKQLNYKGSMTIEHETKGNQRKQEILESKIFLENLIAKTYSTVASVDSLRL